MTTTDGKNEAKTTGGSLFDQKPGASSLFTTTPGTGGLFQPTKAVVNVAITDTKPKDAAGPPGLSKPTSSIFG